MSVRATSVSDIASVAKIGRDLAVELDVDFTDYEGNFVVSLQYAQFLKPHEFEVIPQNCDVSKMPIIPKKGLLKR